MSGLAQVDKNMAVETTIERENIKLFNIRENSAFKIDGIFWQDGKFRRISEDLAKSVNDGVFFQHANTAGGRVRFITDSDYVAIHCELEGVYLLDHMAFTGAAGFDLYERNGGEQEYKGTYRMSVDMREGYESVIDLDGRKLREFVINFPLFCNVKELYVGLRADAIINQPTPYKYELPIVYYGSSITHGACASRPGNIYQSMISRMLDCNFVNLGFSGSAKGEDTITEYIKKLPMSCFVLDYDHNAPTPEFLAETHEKMFKAVREANPDLPILMLTRPKVHLTDEEKKRLEVVRNTYNNAVNAGDKNVYFIPGNELISKETTETATVDNCHPQR